MDDLTSGPVVVAPDEPRKRSGVALKWLFALIVVAAVAAAFWWTSRGAKTGGQSTADSEHQRDAQIESLMHSVSQIRSGTDSLRARLDDSDKMDKSVRDQFVALNERTRLLEDAIANLSSKRLSGHDTLALDEAELLLTLGGERFNLFRDPTGAIAAYHSADAALAEVEDAAFSTVRQSINAEISALNGLQAADTSLLVTELDQLRTRVAQLPASRKRAESADAPPSDSRLMRVLGAFVQVHHDDDAHKLATLTDTSLARELVALDLRDAQGAALARDAVHFQSALATAKSQIAAAFDTATPDVATAMTQIDTLEKAQLAPAPPSILGASLKELRNLRASHALRASNSAPIPSDVLNGQGAQK